MEEKTVPWWRRALSFALDSIRSGFGLFSRSAKNKATEEPEIVAGQQENPDKEAELTEDSPKLKQIADAVNEAETHSAPEAEVVAEPVADVVVSYAATANSAPIETAAVAVEPVIEPALEPVVEPEPAVEPAPETETEAASEPVAATEPVAVAKLIAEDTTEDAVEEAPAPIEAPASPAAEVEIVEDMADEPAVEAVFSPVIAEDATAGTESVEQPGARIEPTVEAVAEVEAPPEPVAELSEPVEQIAERDAEPESEASAEPAAMEEPAPAEELAAEPVAAYEMAPKIADSPVESIEPAMVEAPEEAGGQPGAAEEESVSKEAPEAEVEAEPEMAQDAEPAAEQEPEPVDTHKEIMESTPQQLSEPAATEPAAADDAVVLEALPVENAASEPVPVAEEPASAAEESAPEDAEEAASVAAQPVSPAEAPVEVQAVHPIVEPEAVVEAAGETAPEPVAAATVETATSPEDQEADEALPEPAPAPPHTKPFIKLETRDNEADLSPFSVVVSQVYDGPLDLLLDLIRKQDIDIYDIPISRITAQFLAYVNQLKATDVDVAGEFIYMASLLIHIKSKMLLPRAPAGPDEAAEDPRRELVERLLEHERFKSAAQMLQQKQMLEAASWTNPGMREFQDDAGAEPEIAADTVDLVRIFRDILERARNRPVINLQEDSVTVGQMIQFLSRRLTMEDKPIALRRLLSHTKSERALIAMFLALLELVRLQAILLRQDRAFSEIFIKKNTGFESVMNEGLANARDDWK